ncbi:MAG TPA: hypothetical protein PLL69_10280, partial [Gemmatimonadales bacterium]|nr:hypothetical protein [Gemmatimonadales bacterium]
LQFRASWRGNDDGLGLGADLWAARSKWSSDSIDQDIGTFGAKVGLRRPTWSAESRLLHHSEWTPLDARLAFGWSPLSLVSASVDGVYQEHSNDRISQYATARVGISVPRGTRLPLGIPLPVGLELGGTVSHGERVDAPALWELPTAEFSDYELMAAVDFGRRLKAEARWQSLDAWQPLSYAAFPAIPSSARQPRTEWLSLKAQLAPTSWFTVASHYEHPLDGFIPDGLPPHHAWTTATISSRFLRNFPSGIFRLKVQGVVETWSPGVIGRDAEGEAIEIKGLTFVRGIIQLKIGPFVAYWDRVNFQANRNGQIPGYPIMSLGSSYGIRWEFNN